MTETVAKTHFTISTAISYPNAEPHLGHAYEAIATDALARFKRLDGHPVFFMTGVDVHGLKMKQTAAKQGVAPLELAERNTAKFKEMLGELETRKFTSSDGRLAYLPSMQNPTMTIRGSPPWTRQHRENACLRSC